MFYMSNCNRKSQLSGVRTERTKFFVNNGVVYEKRNERWTSDLDPIEN